MVVLHLACACADNAEYAPHSAAMLDSVLAHRGGLDVHVHYLTGPKFPPPIAAAIGAMVERAGGAFSLHTIPDEAVAGLPPFVEAPLPSVWFRVLLPELAPELERVLYLDLDTIVVDDLTPLWETDLEDHCFAAVTNVFMAGAEGREARLGMRPGVAYFNSGVMLMDLARWRREHCTALVVECARARPDLKWADQDAMNIVIGDRRLPLHPRWNCMNSVLLFPQAADVFGAQAVDEARRRPAIRHFEGPSVNKPWHYLCERESRELYFRHRRGTPWPQVRLEGRTPRNVARRFAQRFTGPQSAT